MKFEEIESTWALQQPVTPAPVDLAALQSSLRSQLGRRKRMLVTAGISAVVGLVVMQALFFINMRAPQAGSTWVALAGHQSISLVLLVEIVRVYLRHRRLEKGRASSVREIVGLSLAGVEGEMADYRMGRWMLLVLAGHSFLSIYLNRSLYGDGMNGFGVRVGIIVIVYGVIGLVCWRHYRVNLQPRRDELKATLAELQERN